MSRGKSNRNDRSNLEKMKREMRRKKEKAESLAGGAGGSPAPPEPPEPPEFPAQAKPPKPSKPAKQTKPEESPELRTFPARPETSVAADEAAADGTASVVAEVAAASAIVAEGAASEIVVSEAVTAESVVFEAAAAETVVSEAATAENVVSEAATAENVVSESVVSETASAVEAVAFEIAASASAADVPQEREVSIEAARDRKLDLVIFQTGAEKFAFRLTHVREIVRVEGLRSVPGAPEHVVGLRNLRGEVLPVIDLRSRFRMPPRAYDDDSRMIVAEVHGSPVGMITDRISEVATVDVSDVMEPPANIRRIDEGYMTGIVARGRDLVMVLDAEKLIGTIADRGSRQDESGGRHEERDAHRDHRDRSRELVVFQVGRENYALDIGHVREILRYGELLHVPNAHPCVEGVMTVRNRLLAVINPGSIFGLRDHRICESARIVVVQTETMTFGIVVDQVSEVARVPEDRFHKPVHIAGAGDTDLVSDIVELNRDRRMAMVLDPRRLTAFAELGGLYAGLGQARHGSGTADQGSGVSDKGSGATDHGRIAADHGADFSRDKALQEKIVTFRVDGGEYGIGMDRVREISHPDRIVGIPGTPGHIPGMASLRGDLFPLVNLRVLFGFADHADFGKSRLLVVEHGGQRAGLLVDEVSEVLDVDRERFEPVSRLAEAADRRKYVDRFCKLDGGRTTVLMVNLDAALEGVL